MIISDGFPRFWIVTALARGVVNRTLIFALLLFQWDTLRPDLCLLRLRTSSICHRNRKRKEEEKMPSAAAKHDAHLLIINTVAQIVVPIPAVMMALLWASALHQRFPD